MSRFATHTTIDGDPAISFMGMKVPYWSDLYTPLKRLADFELAEEQGRLIEQKHGHWIPNKIMIKSPYANNYHCSECTQVGTRTQYCPNCGAKMDEVE